MKNIILNITKGLGLVAMASIFSSCEQFLDKTPLDEVTPASYLTQEADLAAYTIAAYSDISNDNSDAGAYSGFDTYTNSGWDMSTFLNDAHSDDIVTSGSYDLWYPGYKKVQTTDASYEFKAIRNCNYFFEVVLPRYEAGQISGGDANIQHYIGEMYFIRAWTYFRKLKLYGDFPIITEVLVDDFDVLVAASQRKPRNEVARFILEDLDKAIELMQSSFSSQNRLTSRAALLLKSRVALYEGSWEKYFKGTAFVPGNSNWPGAAMSYNSGYTVDIDTEIKFFLTEAMDAAKQLADVTTLTQSTEQLNPEAGQVTGWNPYFDMFCSEDLSNNSEAIFWKAYSLALNVTHSVPNFTNLGGNCGVTKGAVDTYLMANGLPIYASGSGYSNDDTSIDNLKVGRDRRLGLFVYGETDIRRSVHTPTSDDEEDVLRLGMPGLFPAEAAIKDVTGYRNRKMHSFNNTYQSSTPVAVTASIIFRGAEAYLNYIEAQYMRDGSLDGTSDLYWKAIRNRVGTSDDYAATIAATDLTKENDWGAYSAGVHVDATMYNIRRERRMEFLGESLRWEDLKRWRALDQVENYIVEGVNFWDKMYADSAYLAQVVTEEGDTLDQWEPVYFEPGGEEAANISAKSDSKYVRPLRINTSNNYLYDGYTWTKAAYLSPLPAGEFLTTADPDSADSDGVLDLSSSPLYQNPGWQNIANTSASDVPGM